MMTRMRQITQILVTISALTAGVAFADTTQPVSALSKFLTDIKSTVEKAKSDFEHTKPQTAATTTTSSTTTTTGTNAGTTTITNSNINNAVGDTDTAEQPATATTTTTTTTTTATPTTTAPEASAPAQTTLPAVNTGKAVEATDGSPLSQYVDNKNGGVTGNNKITLNFTNIPTRELMQIFSQFTGLNFIISDNVKGNMSIHLDNIPWQQALDAVLKSQGLEQRRVGTAIIIAPLKEVLQQETQELEAEQSIQQLKFKQQIENLQAQQRIEDLQPLVNDVITLNYSKATDMKDLLTKDGSLLSSRGKVGVDIASNSLWIRDTELHATQIAALVRRLDSPVKQVLIEARVVKIERPYEKSLGIRWGVTSAENNLSGNLVGANYFVNGQPAPATTPVLTDRLNFNTPASALNNGTLNPGTVGLAFAQLGNFNIDLELSALEYEGKLETISKPRLVTSNLQTAKISNGEEIPYQEASSSGATSISYKEASLSLEVTPRITPDNRVILNLKVANNQQGANVDVGNNGQAVSINTEEEESQVLVNNNQTIVLGGIFTLQKNKTVTRIPFFGQIPIIGYLFKQSVWKNSRTELLIFITPKIIKKPSDLSEE